MILGCLLPTAFCIFIAAPVVGAQLPPSQTLSTVDNRGFAEELNRLHSLLASANDPGAVQFQIARTYAAAGQYRETIDWLRKVIGEDLGFDPSRDSFFAPLRHTREFQALVRQAVTQTSAVSHSRFVTSIAQTDLFPESMAYDPAANSFYLGSTAKGEIHRCPNETSCEPFAKPEHNSMGFVLGLKIHKPSHSLWATINTQRGAGVSQYKLISGEHMRSARLPGLHLFNDLAISRRGELFVTDTKEGAVYQLSDGASTLRRIAPGHVFTSANGIALSPDERTLYVASFGDGITAVDLRSQAFTPLWHPPSVSLAYIDGLYAYSGGLLAIQNGPMTPRIVRFRLSSDGRKISAMAILERRNPLFDGLTTGDLIGNTFYYIPNSHLDEKESATREKTKLTPLEVLAIDIAAGAVDGR